MNKKLSETTVSLASMKQIVEERTRVLEALSRTDSLTNVANRRALFERGNVEFSRVQRNQSQLTVVLLDCDLFKNINDEFGHLFGDEVLKNICKIGTKEIRSIDFFARYGGEEFIILLPDTDLNSAVETAKRIQYSLANNCISCQGKKVNVTISIGICSADAKHANFEQLIQDVDMAMYKAKSKGRNRIEVIEGDCKGNID
jgi:diguanylate cyclase (GGDEF)-like protein